MHYTLSSLTFEVWMIKTGSILNRFLLILFLLNISPLAAYVSISANESETTEVFVLSHSSWKQMIESDYIITQFRWLIINDGTRVIERKAGMVVQGISPEQVAAVIRDYKIIPKWMNAVNEAQLIKSADDNLWVIFLIFKLPWPLRNKYLINEVREQKHSFLPLYSFKINSSDKYKPPFECKINDFGHYEGEWKVYSWQKDITYIEFSAFSTAPPQFPRWIQDPIINRSFTKTMESFYKLLNSKD